MSGVRSAARVLQRRWYVALPVVLLFATAVLAQASGRSIDPTDPANFNTFDLVNDSSEAVVVRVCTDAQCHHFIRELGWEQVRPGAADRVEVAWGDRSPTTYLVKDRPEGTVVGCVKLFAEKKRTDNQTVAISSAMPCPT